MYVLHCAKTLMPVAVCAHVCGHTLHEHAECSNIQTFCQRDSPLLAECCCFDPACKLHRHTYTHTHITHVNKK